MIVGIENIDSLLAQGRGLIILTPHLGAFELGPRLFARHHPISIMYRPARHPRMEAVLRAFRPSSRIKTVPANGTGVRHFVRTLRSGGVVGLLPDQVPSAGEGVWAPFFGKPAYTMTLPLRLAHMTGAPIVWALVKRVPGNWSMSMHGWQPGMDPSQAIAAEDWVSAAGLMNQQVEALVMLAPQDYLWTYNRYRMPRPAETFMDKPANHRGAF
jgi:KDO2-lipid IV(A) lauroyltransferase